MSESALDKETEQLKILRNVANKLESGYPTGFDDIDPFELDIGKQQIWEALENPNILTEE